MPALVQQKYAINTGAASTTQTVALTTTPATTDLLVLCIYEYSGTGGTARVTSVTGYGATWTKEVAGDIAPDGIAVSLWVGRTPSTSTQVTITSGGGQQNEVNLAAFSGVNNVATRTTATYSRGISGAPTHLSGGSVSANSGDLIVGLFIDNGGSATPVVVSDSWPALTDGGYGDFYPAYLAPTSNGTYEHTGDVTGSNYYVRGATVVLIGPVVNASVAGALASITVAAPAGTVGTGAAVAGPLPSVTVAALAGRLWLPGALTTITFAAPAGSLGTGVTIGGGTDANVGKETLVEATMTPNIALAALAGTVYTSHSGPVPGVLASITLATAGDVQAFALDRSGNVINLTLITNDVPHQPGSLLVSVGNGPPNGIAYFFLDGSSTNFYSVALDASGSVLSVTVPIGGLSMGVHNLAVGGAVSTPEPTSSTPFTVDEAAVTDTTPTPAYPPAVTTTRWTFQAYDYDDPMNIPTYEFGFNPSKLTQNFGETGLTTAPVIAPEGPVVIWEGAPRPLQWTWSGTVLTKYHHDALLWWSELNSRVWLTDEFLRRYLIKIEALTMTRRRDVDNAWHHTYEMTATILDGAGVLT